jgi:hypothetical protein
MVLSGLYEAALDRKVLDAIAKHEQEPESAHIYRIVFLLYAVLVGNLRLGPRNRPEPRDCSAYGDLL